MKGKRLFLQWALFTSVIVVGACIAAGVGWVRYLREDPTHITLLTLAAFSCVTALLGRLCWRLSVGHDPEEIEADLDHGWFTSSLCVSIGLIGTAIGYLLMIKSLDVQGQAVHVRAQMAAGMGIALINTVIGAVCGALVEIQSHFIGHAAAKTKRQAAKPAPEKEASS